METHELHELAQLLEELKKRKDHPSETYQPDDRPERNQLAFHKSTAWARLLFGGNRSGKSRSAAQDVYWTARGKHPYQNVPKASRIWCLSSEYRTLFEGIWLHLKNVIPPHMIERVGPKVPGHDLPTFIELTNGSRIDFISAMGGQDTRRRLQAAEIDLLVVDEEISDDYWQELQMRLVTRGGRVIVSATRIEGEQWLNDLEDQSKNDPEIRVFYLDSRYNKYNNAAVLNRVIKNLSDEEQEVRIFGKRRRSTGLVYSNFSEKNLCTPFTIPPEWTRVMCLDPGFRVTAALYVAISPDYTRYAYREIYAKNSGLPEIVHELKIKEGYSYQDGLYKPTEQTEKIHIRLIDPAAFSHLGDGTVGVGVQLANDYQLYFSPATNDKLENIECVRRWLMPNADGSSQFFAFDNLYEFFKEREKYRLKGDKGKKDSDSAPDRPIKRDDHLMNCWEYIATARVQYMPALDPRHLLRKEVIDNVAPRDSMHRVLLHKERQQMKREQLRRSRM